MKVMGLKSCPGKWKCPAEV